MGVTDLVELELKLAPGPVIRQKPRPLNPTMKESFDHQISDWLQHGDITESVSEYSSPLVTVKKKDGTIRWCIDFRQVNNRIIADSFPISHIEELVQKAVGKKLYSALDCFAAYNHVRVHQDSRKYTAFSTPDGHYEYLRMPFGLKTAVSVYSRFVAPNRIGIYLDDMLVFTDDPYEHLKTLEEVFQKHREVGLMLKPSKTFLFLLEVEYLGHQLSVKGIAMVPSYQAMVTSWPSPKSKQELIHMLGVFGYYRAFIPNFAKTKQGFTALRKTGVEFKWTPELEKKVHQSERRL